MNRITEPSTWAGLAALLQLAKIFTPPQYHIVIDALTAGAGSAAVTMREGAAK
jgi:hypothetical protein